MNINKHEDEFTFEVKKFYIENALAHVEKFNLILKPTTWTQYKDQIDEFLKISAQDAQTNELKYISQWFEFGNHILSQNNYESLMTFLGASAEYLKKLFERPSDSENLFLLFKTKLIKTNQELYLLCHSSNYLILIPSKQIVEILSYVELAPLPYPNKLILGLLSLRGEMISVLNPEFFGLNYLEPKDRKFLILFKIKNEWVTLPIESADRLLEVDKNKLKDTSTMDEVFLFEGKTALFLDIEKIGSQL
ncbi:MAG TPA: chemotaxis protein CheW [Pseudobdellovibrionaceae bacterium]|nr:chemotaxis protein CheW [Pseudobdellovibrionaceae bacterium]